MSLNQMDQKLAHELHKRKKEADMKEKLVQKILLESEDVKQLKDKIRQAYVNKERAAQIAESQTRKLNSLQEEAEIEEYLIKQKEREVREMREKEAQKIQDRIHHKYVLREQIDDKKKLMEEAQIQFEREKNDVDQIFQKIINEDKLKIETEEQKKKEAFLTMQEALREKERQKEEQRLKEERENEEYRKYLSTLEQREYEFKMQKEELEATKAAIYERMKREQTARQAEVELMENLREELYREELEAKARQRERENLEKLDRQKEQMRIAEIEDLNMKQKRREEEAMMEEKFKADMMKKFAEEGKLEQMALQKRRMKELEHKREVERLWKERINLYKREKENEMNFEQQVNQNNQWKEELIRIEKEKLLREHLPYIQGFLPKGMMKNDEDQKYFQNTNNQSQGVKKPQQSTKLW